MWVLMWVAFNLGGTMQVGSQEFKTIESCELAAKELKKLMFAKDIELAFMQSKCVKK